MEDGKFCEMIFQFLIQKVDLTTVFLKSRYSKAVSFRGQLPTKPRFGHHNEPVRHAKNGEVDLGLFQFDQKR